MPPLQVRIKIYIIVASVLHILSFVGYYIIYKILSGVNQTFQFPYPMLIIFSTRFCYFMFFTSILVVFFGISVYFFAYKKGINRYKEIQKRIEDFVIQEDFNLKRLDFPEEDEFGNIGMAFNAIISKLEKYDEIKMEKLFVEFEKTKILSDMIDTPILFVSIEDGEKIVKYYNEKFEKIFAKKNDKEFYDIKNMRLNSLRIGIEENKSEHESFSVMETFKQMSETEMVDSFIDKEFEDAIDLAISEKRKTDIRKEIKTIRGDEKYKSGSITIHPVLARNGEVLEVIIVFNELKKIK
jgi:hypothetical protein